MNRTVEDVINTGLCCGCGTCAGLCPNAAIEMVRTKDGYIPNVDAQKCNSCGLCYNVCPALSVNFKKHNLALFGETPKELLGNYTNCYIGHTNDINIRHTSTSGGLVTSLLIFALDEGIIDGAIVTRMNRKNPLTPEVLIAKNRNEIIQASKSKYCPVPVNTKLNDILKAEGKFAVVGLPCHIQGIRKAEMINPKLAKKIVLHFALFCNHAPTFSATDYLLQEMKIAKNDVATIDYRSQGWTGGLSVTLKNGKKASVGLNSPYYWGHVFNKYFFANRCILCNDKVCEFSDISFGDAWLPEIKKTFLGKSMIISRTPIGEELISKALLKEKITLDKVSCAKVIESQGLRLVKKRLEARFFVSKLLGKKTPEYNQKLLKSGPKAYFNAVLVFSRKYVSSKRCLWRLINTYLFLTGLIKRKSHKLPT